MHITKSYLTVMVVILFIHFLQPCAVILSSYSYLHGCETPIVHGNLSCDTIFIQHNGLIKIGSGKAIYVVEGCVLLTGQSIQKTK